MEFDIACACKDSVLINNYFSMSHLWPLKCNAHLRVKKTNIRGDSLKGHVLPIASHLFQVPQCVFLLLITGLEWPFVKRESHKK